MMRRLQVWRLRRKRDRLAERVDWIREHVYSGQIALRAAEAELRAVQAELWCIEPISDLLDPSRAEPGLNSKG